MSLFDKRKINKVAKDTKFVKRKRCLSGFDFLLSMTLGLVGMKIPSLAAIADSINSKIRRQSLHERFTEEAVTLEQAQ